MTRRGLRATSEGRREQLTNAETVRLGRRLVQLIGVTHVSYPVDTRHVAVEMWDTTGPIRDEAIAALEEVIGPFQVEAIEA